MNPVTFFWKRSIGKKWLVALTGLVLVGYVIGHLVGNLQIFFAPNQINDYAKFLHSSPGLLWAVRIFLIACFVTHIVATIKLVIENRAARPERYVMERKVQATWASRLMPISGLVVLAFVVFHIMHFTTRSIGTEFRVQDIGGRLASEYDVHTMVVLGFRGHPLITGFYILGLFLLGLHLTHGFSSLAQTFGINSKRIMAPMTYAGRALAWTLFAGYLLIPVGIWLGWITLSQP